MSILELNNESMKSSMIKKKKTREIEGTSERSDFDSLVGPTTGLTGSVLLLHETFNFETSPGGSAVDILDPTRRL